MRHGLVLQFRKEIRALLPWWAAVVVVMVICWLLEPAYRGSFYFQGRLPAISLFTYALGAVCLGALSIGHEYGSRTLTSLLTQPVTRQQLLGVKWAALTVSLLLLALVRWATFEIPRSWPISPSPNVIFWLPPICALCLAPWMTMVSRGTLPGVVFSVAVPVVLLIAGPALGVPDAAMWPIAGVLAVIAAALTWRTFARLEVAGDHSSEFDLVPWSSAQSTNTRGNSPGHPYAALLLKELRLHQVTFVLAGLFTALWIAVALAESRAPDLLPDSIRFAAAFVHGGLVSVLCGALASAEERRLGTADWQRLLPVTHRTQWVIKVGTALTVALLLASALPAMLNAIAPEPVIYEGFHPMIVVVLCVSALYVSSLSGSGIHATLATLPAMAAAAAVVVLVLWPVTQLTVPLVRNLAEWVYPLLDLTQPDWRWRYYPHNAGLIIGIASVLSFAGANHRTDERNRSRLIRQGAWLAALVLAVLLVSILTEAIMLEWIRHVAPRG